MSFELFSNYLIILILTVIFFVSTYSMGLFANHYLKLNLIKKNQIIWIGILFLPIILMILNFILPISIYLNLIILFFFLIYFLTTENKVYFVIKHFFKNNKLTIFFYFLCLIILTKQTPLYDTGLYHLQAIKWFNENNIVPGLSNLNNRLGFNIVSYYLSAYLNFPLSINLSYITVSLFVYVLTFNTLINLQFERLESKNLIIFIALIGLSFKRYLVSSASPDLIVFCQEIIVITYLLNYFLSYKKNENDLLFIFLICNFIFYNKLSSIFFCFIIILILILLYRKIILKNLNIFLLSILIFSFFIWIVRSYLLSGMPFYPNTFIHLDFLDWAADKYETKRMVIDFYNWSVNKEIITDVKISLFKNFSNWFFEIESYQKLYLMIILLLSLTVVINYKKIFFKKELIIFFFFLIGNIFFILINLPQIRFFETSLIGLILILFIINYNFYKDNILINNSLFYLFSKNIFLFLFIFITFFKSVDTFSNKWKGSNMINNNNFKLEVNRNNFKSFVTIQGDQCWNWKLPCTFRLNQNLSKKNFTFFDKSFFYYSIK